MTDVYLSHPDSGQKIACRPDQVAVYTSQGWREATPDAPAGNASLAAWVEFAKAKGFTDEDLEGKNRDDIRAALA